MKQYNESDITFEYDENVCQGIHFDKNIAYKKVDNCLKSTKGVDFILIEQNKKLLYAN